jgi:hypothetical protein
MNQKNVKKREVLSYKDFMKVANDPWNPENLSKEDRNGFHKIKPESAYDYVGYKDAVFNGFSKIDYPGYGATESGSADSMGVTE